MSAANFLAAWSSGVLGVPFQSATSAQVHRLYWLWCAKTGEVFPLQHEVLSRELVGLCSSRSIEARIKVMGLKSQLARMFLVEAPPFEGQGQWAVDKANKFESYLQAFAESLESVLGEV